MGVGVGVGVGVGGLMGSNDLPPKNEVTTTLKFYYLLVTPPVFTYAF